MSDRVQLAERSDGQQRQQNRQTPGADAGDEIELEKESRPPYPLEFGAEHPQRQHVEQDVKQPCVDEHVRDDLIDAQVVHHPLRAPGRAESAAPVENVVARNITTFAPMMALSAVDSGPGPNENDDVWRYGEVGRGMWPLWNRTTSIGRRRPPRRRRTHESAAILRRRSASPVRR